MIFTSTGPTNYFRSFCFSRGRELEDSSAAVHLRLVGNNFLSYTDQSQNQPLNLNWFNDCWNRQFFASICIGHTSSHISLLICHFCCCSHIRTETFSISVATRPSEFAASNRQSASVFLSSAALELARPIMVPKTLESSSDRRQYFILFSQNIGTVRGFQIMHSLSLLVHPFIR